MYVQGQLGSAGDICNGHDVFIFIFFSFSFFLFFSFVIIYLVIDSFNWWFFVFFFCPLLSLSLFCWFFTNTELQSAMKLRIYKRQVFLPMQLLRRMNLSPSSRQKSIHAQNAYSVFYLSGCKNSFDISFPMFSKRRKRYTTTY